MILASYQTRFFITCSFFVVGKAGYEAKCMVQDLPIRRWTGAVWGQGTAIRFNTIIDTFGVNSNLSMVSVTVRMLIGLSQLIVGPTLKYNITSDTNSAPNQHPRPQHHSPQHPRPQHPRP